MNHCGFIPEKEWESIPSTTGTNHLLVIGIDQYENWIKLNNAVRDCRALVDVLHKQYRFEKVYQVFNKDATRRNLWKVFEGLKERVKNIDNLLIYYAGHGYMDKNGWGYWVPVEGRKGEPYNYFKNRDILDWIKTFDCHHLMLISDSCFSGSLKKRGKVIFEEAFSREPSRWLLSSGRIQEVFDGEVGKGSPFNNYLVKYLKNNSGALLFSELANKVKISTNAHTEMFQTPLAEPLEIKGHESGEFVFIPSRGCKMVNSIPEVLVFSQLEPPKGKAPKSPREKLPFFKRRRIAFLKVLTISICVILLVPLGRNSLQVKHMLDKASTTNLDSTLVENRILEKSTDPMDEDIKQKGLIQKKGKSLTKKEIIEDVDRDEMEAAISEEKNSNLSTNKEEYSLDDPLLLIEKVPDQDSQAIQETKSTKVEYIQFKLMLNARPHPIEVRIDSLEAVVLKGSSQIVKIIKLEKSDKKHTIELVDKNGVFCRENHWIKDKDIIEMPCSS